MNLENLQIRPASFADVPGINQLHAHCEDPWADPSECPLWVNHRLLRPFHIDLALLEDRVVGHAEWIVSHEPEPHGRHLYLGILDVHPDHQRRGIGRRMVATGVRRAAALSCARARTIPDEDAIGFYQKCGLRFEQKARTFALPLTPSTLPSNWSKLRTVPRDSMRRLPMRIGWVQASAAHMWELCNRPVRIAGEDERHPCIGRTDKNAYVQLRYLGNQYPAMALSWASPDVPLRELIAAAMALAASLPIDSLNFTTLAEDAEYLTSRPEARQSGTGEIWSIAAPP